MRTQVIIGFLLVYSSAIFAQDKISLTFSRPSKFTGSASKITLSFDDQEISLKNGATISLNLPMTQPKTIKITSKIQMSRTQHILHAIPGEDYTFEVGLTFSGTYIKLLSGREDVVITSNNKADSSYLRESSLRLGKDGIIGFNAEKTHSSDEIRKEWLKKGGKVNYTSVALNGVYFTSNLENYGDYSGYGGGLSLFTNNLNLKIPEYKSGITTWNSYNWGAGVDLLLYRMEYGYDEELFSMDMNTLIMNFLFTLDLGWTLGVGKFKTEEQWKGVALIFKYRPAVSLVTGSSTVSIESSSPYVSSGTTTTTMDPDFNFNFGGFGFDFQFSNFYATMDELAPMPTMKFSLFFLPPIGENPLFISVGMGVLMYNK